MPSITALQFEQIHVDVARNSTDDFNPFHDPRRFDRIAGNPYPRPLVLGFQLECLCDFLVERQRDDETLEAGEQRLRYRSFQFTFADALWPGEACEIEVRPTLSRKDPPGLSNRVVVRKGGRAVLLGQVRDATEPLVPTPVELDALPDLRPVPDRSLLPGTGLFLKRKFLNTANAKNFLAGSLVDQAHYFDEIAERVRFPPLFPCALASCALLEKAWSEHHDFMADPMVYVAHAITVDRPLASSLRSNDVLHLLVRGPTTVAGSRSLGGTDLPLQRAQCFGLLRDQRVLYAAEIDLAPLRAITGARLPPGDAVGRRRGDGNG
ncbi:MAG: hypothetical protein MUE39_07055 [Gammaproteobacteria bacterium]|jgi:hypothetical protein|nr:hypothetical protein [Gammaproteobacteria bacterium]